MVGCCSAYKEFRPTGFVGQALVPVLAARGVPLCLLPRSPLADLPPGAKGNLAKLCQAIAKGSGAEGRWVDIIAQRSAHFSGGLPA